MTWSDDLKLTLVAFQSTDRTGQAGSFSGKLVQQAGQELTETWTAPPEGLNSHKAFHPPPPHPPPPRRVEKKKQNKVQMPGSGDVRLRVRTPSGQKQLRAHELSSLPQTHQPTSIYTKAQSTRRFSWSNREVRRVYKGQTRKHWLPLEGQLSQGNTLSLRALRKQRAHRHCREARQNDGENSQVDDGSWLIKTEGRVVRGPTELAQPVTACVASGWWLQSFCVSSIQFLNS